MTALILLFSYFALLYLVSRRSGTASNDAFFRAGRRAPWAMVAFGMIGASISGVSLVSVPGWVASTGMSYLQMCAGFFFGYLIVAFVLLPLYYRLHLTSIYGFLGKRFGDRSHRTGAAFFILSKLTGAAARLYLACIILQAFLPIKSFPLLVTLVLALIWCYTCRSGIAAIVRTDALQTACMLLATTGILGTTIHHLGIGLNDAWTIVRESPMSQVMVWDAGSRQYVWRQFFSGIFIVIVMTGLDQDMMQKNLTCSSLRNAQKDMCCYGMAFLPVNALFLALGILLYYFCTHEGLVVPQRGDDLLPMLIGGGHLGTWVIAPFVLGIASAAFSSADSAITSLTTSICVDMLQSESNEQLRRRVHLVVIAAFFLCILAFRAINSSNAIDAIYTMAGYTYGPLLGLYAFGLTSRRRVTDSRVPYIALAAPIVCALLDFYAPRIWGYTFGYELLMLNGLITAIGLLAVSRKDTSTVLAKERTIIP